MRAARFYAHRLQIPDVSARAMRGLLRVCWAWRIQREEWQTGGRPITVRTYRCSVMTPCHVANLPVLRHDPLPPRNAFVLLCTPVAVYDAHPL
jgi:hypothetical protein